MSLQSGIKKYQTVHGFALASSLQEELAVIAAVSLMSAAISLDS